MYDKLGTSFSSQHVKDHQDRSKQPTWSNIATKPTKEAVLSWEAKLNIEADCLATVARKDKMNQSKTTWIQFPACRAHLYISNRQITRQMKKTTRTAWNLVEVKKDYKTRFGWTNTTFAMIDFGASSRSRKRMDYYEERFVVWYIHKRLPVNGAKYMAQQNKLYPCCNMCKTKEQFLLCTENPTPWNNIMTKLQPIFRREKVNPALRLQMHSDPRSVGGYLCPTLQKS